jgi:ferredoxin
MKHLIYWFSGTGNTLAVAKDLVSRLKDAEAREIRDNALPVSDGDTETIGILYPVYCWGPPNIVAEFTRKIAVPQNAYVYAVAVYGGMLASSNAIVARLLRARDIPLAASFGVNLPGNFVGVYDIAPKPKLEKMYAKADAAIGKIAEAVRDKKATRLARNLGPLGRYLSGSKYGPIMAQINFASTAFTVDESCSGCGICARVCPKGNIRLDSKKPKWDTRCESCLACLHWCPTASIQSGDATRKHGRYHHPAVTASELFRR